MRGVPPSRSPAEGSPHARGAPSRSPAEGSFMRGVPPSRSPAEGSLIAKFAEQLVERYGERLDAVILYGSYLRGVADAMPDLYVLLDEYPPRPRLHRWLGSLLPPNVHDLAVDGRRAKISVLRTHQLLKAVTLDLHPYFWRGSPNPTASSSTATRKSASAWRP